MNKPAPGQVRIIAGTLRGSKLPVPELPGLRPSSDRARETLFNWLQHEVAGRRVLDLFAGTGALGFEAASRGAAEVWLLERDPRQAQSLADSAKRLKTEQVRVQCVDAIRWLADSDHGRFDLVFIDPPFSAGLWAAAAGALKLRLAEHAWIYLEMATKAGFDVPEGWTLHRESKSREVRHLLFRAECAMGTDTLPGSFHGAGIVQA